MLEIHFSYREGSFFVNKRCPVDADFAILYFLVCPYIVDCEQAYIVIVVMCNYPARDVFNIYLQT